MQFSYSEFADTSKVSKYSHTLLLDKSQFVDLPSGSIKLTDVTVNLIDKDKPASISNVRSVALVGQDVNAIKQMEAVIKAMPKGVDQATKDMLLRKAGDTVSFNVPITNRAGQFEEFGDTNYKWLGAKDIFENGRGKILEDIPYGVTWAYVSQYANKLVLRALDLTNVKVK